jgi:alpha-galactosidase
MRTRREMKMIKNLMLAAACLMVVSIARAADDAPDLSSRILTPPSPAEPRINGAKIYGERAGRPFLYTISATGDRPMTFSAEALPEGLSLDESSGRITGSIKSDGEFAVTLHAKNAKGETTKAFKIVIGDQIGLTPPMGWNSWNCWAKDVDREKVLASARAMVSSGLINHGWTYINIDDSWQGNRGGEFNGIQPNEKFPDMKGFCDEIHAMGLKAGIYSTPWVTSYAGYVGGSADNADGVWPPVKPEREAPTTNPAAEHAAQHKDGKYLFATNDAKQWAAWGIDYLKYDWNPRSRPPVSDEVFHKQVGDMADALKSSGRDIFYSYSNSMPFDAIGDVAPNLNAWRTTGDIRDTWWSLSGIGFSQNKWAKYATHGHWNDPDMLVVGYVGWSKNLHPSNLTPDEQYTHISLWSLLSAPLLIGAPVDRMDSFTLSLLTNDEVLAVDQDSLGKSATLVDEQGPEVTIERKDQRPGARPSQPHTYKQMQVWAKDLDDGSKAVGLFNLGEEETNVVADFSRVGVTGKQTVRDLWRQKDIGSAEEKFESKVAPHGVVLIRLIPVK